MKLLLESRCSIGSPFNLNTIHIDVHVHVVLEIKCPLFQCSEITQRGDFQNLSTWLRVAQKEHLPET